MKAVSVAISWLVCLPAAAFFSFCWGMSAFGQSYLGALSFSLLAVPFTLGVGFRILRTQKTSDWIPFALAILPWVAFPLVAMRTFVPRGETGQWVALLVVTLVSAFVAALSKFWGRNL
jgi:hypothetical protein